VTVFVKEAFKLRRGSPYFLPVTNIFSAVPGFQKRLPETFRGLSSGDPAKPTQIKLYLSGVC
jgi:hypothetical protein